MQKICCLIFACLIVDVIARAPDHDHECDDNDPCTIDQYIGESCHHTNVIIPEPWLRCDPRSGDVMCSFDYVATAVDVDLDGYDDRECLWLDDVDGSGLAAMSTPCGGARMASNSNLSRSCRLGRCSWDGRCLPMGEWNDYGIYTWTKEGGGVRYIAAAGIFVSAAIIAVSASALIHIL